MGSLTDVGLVSLVFAASLCGQQPASGHLSGTVVDPTLEGIPAAIVVARKADRSIPPRKIMTVNHGRFRFVDLPEGKYELDVSAPGFARKTITSIQVAGENDFALSPVILAVDGSLYNCVPEPAIPQVYFAPGTQPATALDGNVVERLRGPLAQVTLTLAGPGVPAPIVTRSNAKGQFRFSALPPGMYSLRATRSGYADFLLRKVEIRSGQWTQVHESLEMEPCPSGVTCKPVETVLAPVICL